MKLSRLSNNQLRRLLREGEVRFELDNKITWKDKHKAAIGYAERIIKFIQETIRLLENGTLKIDSDEKYSKFSKRWSNLFYGKWYVDPSALQFFQRDPYWEYTTKGAIVGMERVIKSLKKDIDGLKGDLQKGSLIYFREISSRDYENLKSRQWPSPVSYFSEFRK